MKVMMVRDRNVLNTNWLVYLANLFVSKGYDVVIACDTYSKLGKTGIGFDLNNKVKVVNLNGKTKNPLINAYRFLRGKLFVPYFRFNKLIKAEKPDILLCYFPVDLYNVTRFQNHNIPIVQMVHNFPPVLFNKILKKNFLMRAICKKSFKKVHTFQVLMNSSKDKIDPYFEPKNIVRIANPVRQHKDTELVDLSIEHKKIIYVARVEKQVKQPHLLIEAFAKIAKDFPDWKVEIWGIAKYKDYNKELADMIEANNLSNQVSLAGYTTDVEALYHTADIQAFTSNCEGFGLAAADAMAIGLPHVGFSYANSINELIIDGYNGFLADDVDDFAQKLKTLMLDKNLRIKFGKNACESMKEYAPEVIIDQWDNLFNDIIKGK
ncbi:MAG: glycosyltransferase family 4 protein [Alphaproteobacteria bacterium]|nr:glycosyltransferase family 4 protein [Alphaproteobacteria bacterium]